MTWTDSLGGEAFSIEDAIGGWRGAVESLLPGIIFVVMYVATGSLPWTVGLSAGVSVIFVVARLFQRSSPMQAVVGLLGVAIGVVWSLTTGRAENYFAWGILVNGVYGGVIAASILIRQPLGALAVQFLWGLPSGWRKDPDYALLARRSVLATWVWVAVFVLRVAVMAPMYFSGAVEALGIAKLVLGLPVFALAAWATWILLRGLKPSIDAEEADIAE